MNRPYIKTIVESYLIDKDLDDSKLEEFNDYIVESIDYMKENYECAYVTIHEMNNIQQQRYIYNVLDNKDLELNQEFLEPMLIMVGAAAMMIGLDKYGHRTLKELTTRVMKIWVGFQKAIKHKQWFKEHKVTQKILDSNFSDCKRKAGFSEDTSDMKVLIALHPTPIPMPIGSGISPEVDREEVEKGEGLRDCYLDWLVSAIASVSVIYVKCIEESGEVKQQVSTDHGMGALLNIPTGEGCSVIYDQLKDLHEDYMEALDVFFKTDTRERRNWMNRLDEKIRGAQRGEHLRPSIPRREKSGFSGNQGKFVHTRGKRFVGDKNINPTANRR
jgi:hypothetical protein